MNTKETTIWHKIEINPNDNPKATDLIKESNIIIDRYNKIQSRLFNHKISFPYIKKSKSILIEIGRDIQKLQRDWLDWNERFKKFCYEPEFIFPSESENAVAF